MEDGVAWGVVYMCKYETSVKTIAKLRNVAERTGNNNNTRSISLINSQHCIL